MGKKIINNNSSNSTVITNSKVKKNVNQIQKSNKGVESNAIYEILASLHQLTQEVKELKEQLKNKNS